MAQEWVMVRMRRETWQRLREARESMETAELLGIRKSAASKRYIIAIKRLKEVLRNVPGFEERF